MDNFEYKLLADDLSAIRVLLLHPSTDMTSMIRCSLKEARLDDFERDPIHQYTALSYVWGDVHSLVIIYVDGLQFKVTRNLFHALRDLRDVAQERLLWIDAICINQSDINERNQQVSIMGRIYILAQQTIIYFGHGSREDESAFKLLRESLPSINDRPAGSVLRSILHRPWFDRAWVFQELVLSRDPWVQLARVAIRWGRFFEQIKVYHARHLSILWTETNVGTDRSMTDMIRRVEVMHTARQRFQSSVHSAEIHSGRITLEEILRQRRGCGVSDPRDMVFAHQGFINPENNVPIDYSKSVAWVFAIATKNILSSSRNLEFLRLITTSDPNRRHPNLPSWVPDYTSPPMFQSLYDAAAEESASWVPDYTPPMFELSWYVAAAEESGSSRDVMRLGTRSPDVSDPTPLVEGCETLLPLKGKELGVIQTISPIIQLDDISTDHAWQQRLSGCLQDSNQNDQEWRSFNESHEAWLDCLDYSVRSYGSRRIWFRGAKPLNLLSLTPKSAGPRLLPGRRTALLDEYGLVIVPAAAEVGDFVCSIQGTAWLLRSLHYVARCQDENIMYERRSAYSDLRHVTFIGECLFYYTIKSMVEKYPQPMHSSAGYRRLFVIH